MELRLKRIARKPSYTIGHLYANGEYVCDTLEDTDRGLKQSMPLSEIKAKKVYGETAIPTGKYFVTLKVQSPKFKDRQWAKFCDGYLPRLLNVPGYEGVLIHVGATAKDTLGCVICGENKAVGKVLNSATSFKRLYALLKTASDRKESISITID